MLLAVHPYVRASSCFHSPVLKSRLRFRKSVIVKNAFSSNMGETGSSSKLMEFPHLLVSHRLLMVDLIQTIENGLENQLLPCTVPSDVQYYQNQTGTSQGTLLIRSGIPPSPIDFIIASWLHLKQPNGGALNITNIAGYVKTTNDIPHFQFELVQCSPTFLIFFLDFIPRTDIVLRPDYLTTYYEETKLEHLRQQLAVVPEVSPYFSSSLYFRKVVSPTGILVSVKFDDDNESVRVEEIIRGQISSISKDVLRIWIELCVNGGREVAEDERDLLEKRDHMIKTKAIEMDLSKTMPLQFGEEVAERVLRVIRSAFKTTELGSFGVLHEKVLQVDVRSFVGDLDTESSRSL